MALTTQQRIHLYGKFKDVIGAEGADILIAQFPSGELDHPATHDFVRAECALLRTDMAEIRTELKGEIAQVRTELKGEIAQVRTELKDEIAQVRTDLTKLVGDSHTSLLRWFIGTWMTTMLFIVGLAWRLGGG